MCTIRSTSTAPTRLDAIEELQGHGHEIVRYRDERGGFTDLRQLDEVPGLTGKVTDAARARLKIDKKRV